MPVPNTDFQTTYTTDGVTTQYAFAWACVDIASVEVFLDGTQIFTGFTAALNPVTIGGYINFSPVQAGGQTLLIQRVSDTLQNNDFGNNEAIPPVTLVQMFDKLTIICQQLTAQISLSLALSLPDAASGVSGTLPTPIIPGALIGWDAAGTAPYYAVPVQEGWVLTDQGPGQQFISAPPSGGGGGGGNMSGPTPPSTFGAVATFSDTTARDLAATAVPVLAGYGLIDNGIGSAPTFQQIKNVTQHTSESVPPGGNVALSTSVQTTLITATPNEAGTYLVLAQLMFQYTGGVSTVSASVITGGTGAVTILNAIEAINEASGSTSVQMGVTLIGVATLGVDASTLIAQAITSSAATFIAAGSKVILMRIA